MQILDERKEVYGDAWALTGVVIGLLQDGFNAFCVKAPTFIYPWISILCKLIRALKSPHHKDHWLDIAGYATLVLESLEHDISSK